MKPIKILAILLLSALGASAQVVKVAQPYAFAKYIQVHDSISSKLVRIGTSDTAATVRYVRNFIDSVQLSNDTTYYFTGGLKMFYTVVPVLTGTQITQIANSFHNDKFDTTSRILTMYTNGGDSVRVVIPGGTAGSGSGITAQTSAKTSTNIVTLSANTGATVLFSTHDTLFIYGDTTVWNGKIDSVRSNLIYVHYTDTASMLSHYLRTNLGVKYTDTVTLIPSQWLLRKVADSAASAALAVISVNGVSNVNGAITITTSNVNEGSNLYFTNARARSAITANTPITFNSSTGVAGADTASNLSGLLTRPDGRRIADSAGAAYAAAAVAALTTTAVSEGTNLYFTTARAQGAISATSPITYSGGSVGADTTTNVHGLATKATARQIADSAAAAAAGTPYTANSPIGITSHVISADTVTQASGLATIANARRIADSAAANAGGGSYVAPTSPTGSIVIGGNGQVKGSGLTIDLKSTLIVADTTVDSASLQPLGGANGITITNGSKAMVTLLPVTVGITPHGIDSASLTQSPTAIIKALISAAAPLTWNAPSASVGIDTSTNVSGVATRATARKIADSAAAAASGTPYTANAPISISSHVVSADTSTNVNGLLTRSDGRRIADSAAAANSGGGGVSGYNIQWTYGGHTNIPAKGGDSLYINSSLLGKHIHVGLTNGAFTTMLVDSVTWASQGSISSQLYFKYKLTSDTVTLCNTSNVQSLTNGLVFDVTAGDQGFPMNQDTGGVILGPPTVNAGSNQSVTYPTSSATLTGSASSTNPGGSIASYLWSIVSEPGGASAAISAPTSASTPVTNMTALGSYVYKLTATDNTGNSGSSNTTVSVVNATSAIFNFSSTSSSVSGATNFFGNPTSSISVTDATTGWTLANITAGWVLYDGSFFGGTGNGATQASSDGIFTQAQGGSNLYNSTNFATSGYSLQFTNLPAGTYTIELWGSIPSATFAWAGTSEFHVLFGSGSDNISAAYGPNGSGSTGNLTPQGPGTTNVTTGSFTGTITGGQVIKIAVGYKTANSGTNLGFINALKIVKTS